MPTTSLTKSKPIEASASALPGELKRAVEFARLAFLEVASHSDSLQEFLHEAADVVMRAIPIAGLAIWLTEGQESAFRLVTSSGRTPGVDSVRPQSQGDQTAPELLAGLKAVSHELHVDVSHIKAQSPIFVAVWTTDFLTAHFPDEWIRKVFESGLESLRLVHHARQSVSVMSACMQHFCDAMIGLDAAGRCVLWNPAAERLFGWPSADCLNRPLRILAETDLAISKILESALHSGRSTNHELTGRRWDGQEFSISVRVIPICRHTGDCPSLILQIRTLGDSLLEQKWGQAVLESLEDLASIDDLVVAGSKVTSRLHDRRLLSGAEIWLCDPLSNEWDLLSQAIHGPRLTDGGRGAQSFLKEIQTEFDSKSSPTLNRMSPVTSRLGHEGIGIVIARERQLLGAMIVHPEPHQTLPPQALSACQGIASALAQRLHGELSDRLLQESSYRIIQAEKLSTLGLLTSSVAHDLNNVLTVVYGFCAIAGAASDSVPHCIAEIHRAAEKAGRLTQRLLRFSRRDTSSPEVLNIVEALGELRPLLEGLLSRRGVLRIDVQDRAAGILVSQSEFDQLLLNLVANARDAIKERGTVTISVTSVAPDLHLLSSCPHLKAGTAVCLQVIDNGCGIPMNLRAKVFEPFFTTKPAGAGTGLGLQTIRRIVEHHRGGVCIDSVVGEGTVVSLYLPRVATSLAARPADREPRIDPRGSESIVIVEHDSRMRSLLCRLLELRGYRVFASDSNQPAPGKIASDLVILGSPDYLKKMRCDQDRCLILSDMELPGGKIATLLKPFTSDDLSRAVRAVLDRKVACH